MHRRGEQVILGEAFIVGEPLTQIIGEPSQIPGLASTNLYSSTLQLRAGIPEGAIILAFANKALTLLQAEDYIQNFPYGRAGLLPASRP